MKELFYNEQKIIEEEAIKKEKENYENNMRMIAKSAKERKKLTENREILAEDFNQDSLIDKMPDSEEKYREIIKKYKENKEKFTDRQFLASEESLGSEKLIKKTNEWVRASNRQNTIIFRDQINPRDVAQGDLGDCYLIAAISVLNEKDIKERIKFINSRDRHESECGAFWVRFLKYGNPVDVIIDDYFPVSESGKFIFAKGKLDKDEEESDEDELWPMIIEKAYAKLNGSYHTIEGGKVQYALADMIGGVSEQIELRSHKEEKSKLWNRLRSLIAQGALLGAGSKDSINGKETVNSSGIVPKHAYAILGLKQFDGYRLLNLRNPHGRKGTEWNGDWSDDSHMWTQKSRSKCKSIVKKDGIFWMDLDDFFNHFSYLYIFRVMDDWNKYEKKGWWDINSIEGFLSKQNKSPKLDSNPQYELKIEEPGPLFIQMTQLEEENMFKGKRYIAFFVQKTGGGKIKNIDRKKLLGKSGMPINYISISTEIELSTNLKYPLKITLLPATALEEADRSFSPQNNTKNFGSFEIKIFSKSKITWKTL